MRLIAFLLLLCLGAQQCFAQATGLAGTWHGTWTKGGDALPVTMTFAKTESGFSGSFDSDALQLAGIPVMGVSETPAGVHFELRGDQSTTLFDGKIVGDRMSGAFVDGAVQGSFEMVRSPRAPAAIRAQDVSFRNGEVTLSGTVLLPAAPGKHPAILFLQGSGPEGRWANRYLARKFAEAGFVALIYDKRGVGESTGDWRTAGFDALAGDAAAGVAYLRSLDRVDSSQVGVYGHSQGGTIVPLVAERAGGLGFAIASAAGGIDPAAVEIYSVRNSIGTAGLPAAERAAAEAYVDAVVDVAYRGGNRAQLDALAATLKDRSWYFAPPPPDSSYWAISRQIAAYRPADHWCRVKAPVLLAYGARDERIPVEPSLKAIQTTLRGCGNSDVTVRLYPAADHNFAVAGAATGWPKREPDYAAMMIAWVKRQR